MTIRLYDPGNNPVNIPASAGIQNTVHGEPVEDLHIDVTIKRPLRPLAEKLARLRKLQETMTSVQPRICPMPASIRCVSALSVIRSDRKRCSSGKGGPALS